MTGSVEGIEIYPELKISATSRKDLIPEGMWAIAYDQVPALLYLMVKEYGIKDIRLTAEQQADIKMAEVVSYTNERPEAFTQRMKYIQDIYGSVWSGTDLKSGGVIESKQLAIMRDKNGMAKVIDLMQESGLDPNNVRFLGILPENYGGTYLYSTSDNALLVVQVQFDQMRVVGVSADGAHKLIQSIADWYPNGVFGGLKVLLAQPTQ